jgi:hypothetical protein
MTGREKPPEKLIKRIVFIKPGRHARKTTLGTAHLLKRPNANHRRTCLFNKSREVGQAAHQSIPRACGRGHGWRWVNQ